MTDFITRPADDFQMLGHLKRHFKGIDGFIGGGAFKNIFGKQKVKDIDIFFPSSTAWEKACKKFRKRGYKLAYENTRVAAFIDPVTGIRLELIGTTVEAEEENVNWDNEPIVAYGSPEDTIANFDFTVTKFAMFKEGDDWKVVHHPSFFEHLYMQRLVIDAEMVKPLSTFERSYRYAGYGFKLCRESKVKLINAIQETDFDDDAQLSASFYDGMD